MKKILVLFLFLSATNILVARNDVRDILDVGHTLTSNNKYTVGSTCLIFTQIIRVNFTLHVGRKLQHLLMNTNPLECEMYGLQ